MDNLFSLVLPVIVANKYNVSFTFGSDTTLPSENPPMALLSKKLTVYSPIPPLSGDFYIDKRNVSKLQHVETVGDVHTFDMWQEPDFMPWKQMGFVKFSIQLAFDGEKNPCYQLQKVNKRAIWAKVYHKYDDNRDFSFKNNDGLLLTFDFDDKQVVF